MTYKFKPPKTMTNDELIEHLFKCREILQSKGKRLEYKSHHEPELDWDLYQEVTAYEDHIEYIEEMCKERGLIEG